MLKNIDLLFELPFYEKLNVVKRYAMSYKVKSVEKKDPIKELEVSKSSIKDLLTDLLSKTKGFKYQNNTKSHIKKIQAKWRN